jgi:hypothetical protein
MMQIEQIERAALVGNLVSVKCNEQEGDGQVEVLCIRFYEDGKEFLRPVAKLYKDQFDALREVNPPETHRVSGFH